MNKIDDPSQSQPDDPSSFRASAIDDLFEEVTDGPAKDQEEKVPESPATRPEPIVLTEETEEAASAALDAALSIPQPIEEPIEPEADVEPISADTAREIMEKLAAMEAQLRRQEVSREEASRVLKIASEVLERFPKHDPTFEILKDELLDAYFALDRTIRPTLEVPIKPEYEPRSRPEPVQKKKRKLAVAVTRDVSTVRRPRRGRLIAMVFFMVLVGGGRIAYYLAVEQAANKSEPTVTRQAFKDVQGSRVSLDKAGKQSNDFNQGIPVMTYLRVLRLKDGGFGAKAAAIDLNSNSLKYNYKWYKNGKLIKLEHEGLFEAKLVEPLATYKVEATATDGKLTSAPMASAPMVIKPKPKNGK